MRWDTHASSSQSDLTTSLHSGQIPGIDKARSCQKQWEGVGHHTGKTATACQTKGRTRPCHLTLGAMGCECGDIAAGSITPRPRGHPGTTGWAIHSSPPSISTPNSKGSFLALGKLWSFSPEVTSLTVAHTAELFWGNAGPLGRLRSVQSRTWESPEEHSPQQWGMSTHPPFQTSALSLTAREISSLLKPDLYLPLTLIKRGFASWLRQRKKVGRAHWQVNPLTGSGLTLNCCNQTQSANDTKSKTCSPLCKLSWGFVLRWGGKAVCSAREWATFMWSEWSEHAK